MILSMEEILLFGHVKHHDVWGAKAMTIQLFWSFHRKECVKGGSLRMQLCSFAGFWKTKLLFFFPVGKPVDKLPTFEISDMLIFVAFQIS